MKRDLDLDRKWLKLREELKIVIGKKPSDLNGILFLIGVQELGKGQLNFSKEEKQDLIHLGICKVLSLSGYYKLEGIDQDGWPHWKAGENLPNLNLMEQEKLLKINTIDYFEQEIGLTF
ncbi:MULTISPECIES: hypothetical protein [Reichenbachiella]|uniref:hypothetical protein n=1 Tax=Reichenbachiella TaxID=156993 RepID=UPI000E6C9433|nr:MULTISPECIES: hypothetical protein [Reichenbachiella]MBU2914662.1 hypothetical protein [Reichenbachiella agariperforans]RJE71589.1 hypothetical protein BGP76_05710 [Reichenbachiella sp. MSK19-1]